MKTKMKITAVFAGLAFTMVANAAPMIDVQDGSAGNEYTGWTSGALDGFAQPSNVVVNTGVGDAGVLTVDRQAITIAGDAGNATIRALQLQTTAFGTNMNNYEGSGLEVAGLQFDFYSGSGDPSQIGFFVQSAEGTGSVWYYDISPVHATGWQTYSVFFGDSGWYGFTDETWGTPVGLGNFAAALANVSDFGMYVYFNPNEVGQSYGIANYGLTIPEPETYMALGMALLGMAFVFRKRVTDSLAEAKSMIQS